MGNHRRERHTHGSDQRSTETPALGHDHGQAHLGHDIAAEGRKVFAGLVLGCGGARLDDEQRGCWKSVSCNELGGESVDVRRGFGGGYSTPDLNEGPPPRPHDVGVIEGANVDRQYHRESFAQPSARWKGVARSPSPGDGARRDGRCGALCPLESFGIGGRGGRYGSGRQARRPTVRAMKHPKLTRDKLSVVSPPRRGQLSEKSCRRALRADHVLE